MPSGRRTEFSLAMTMESYVSSISTKFECHAHYG